MIRPHISESVFLMHLGKTSRTSIPFIKVTLPQDECVNESTVLIINNLKSTDYHLGLFACLISRSAFFFSFFFFYNPTLRSIPGLWLPFVSVHRCQPDYTSGPGSRSRSTVLHLRPRQPTHSHPSFAHTKNFLGQVVPTNF